jgi:HPt (histidine-containing phosphotransfer) domain-containing protein
MDSLPDDLDLTQAQAFALQARDLADLLDTVDQSLSASVAHLQEATDAEVLHHTLHDLKGYLGLVAVTGLCVPVQQADQAARQGHVTQALDLVRRLIPRLLRLQLALRAYRAGIIDG